MKKYKHKKLKAMYENGQFWQFRSPHTDVWKPCKAAKVLNNRDNHNWIEPMWFNDTKYRIHPYSSIIKQYYDGVPILVLKDETFVNITKEEVNNGFSTDLTFVTNKTTKTLYQWMFKTESGKWIINEDMLTEEQAYHYLSVFNEYKSTGYSVEVNC